MLSIYHKSNCSTSLSVLKIIRDAGIEVKIIDYLDKPLDLIALQQLQEKLKVPAEKMLRKKEKIFQEKYAHKKLSELVILKLIAKHPILLERPILVKGKKAIIARPIEITASFIAWVLVKKNNILRQQTYNPKQNYTFAL